MQPARSLRRAGRGEGVNTGLPWASVMPLPPLPPGPWAFPPQTGGRSQRPARSGHVGHTQDSEPLPQLVNVGWSVKWDGDQDTSLSSPDAGCRPAPPSPPAQVEPAVGRLAYRALAVRPVGHFLQTQRQQHRFISSSGLSPCEVIIPPFLLLQPRKLRGMEARELAQDACFSPTCLLCKLGS